MKGKGETKSNIECTHQKQPVQRLIKT
jgi:hypothetical protein